MSECADDNEQCLKNHAEGHLVCQHEQILIELRETLNELDGLLNIQRKITEYEQSSLREVLGTFAI